MSYFFSVVRPAHLVTRELIMYLYAKFKHPWCHPWRDAPKYLILQNRAVRYQPGLLVAYCAACMVVECALLMRELHPLRKACHVLCKPS
jgi:hypothetical protein